MRSESGAWSEKGPTSELTEYLYASADALQNRLAEVFSERDRLYLDERYRRIRLFEAGVADLFDSLRRQPSPPILETALARVVARIFCIADGVGVSVTEGMVQKYPAEGCAYCGSMPCQCSAQRGHAILAEGPHSYQQTWGLYEWQTHLDRLYGQANRQKGIWFVATRLAVETSELLAEEDKVPSSTIAEIRQNYSLELADTMAWTMATANILDINLHQATLHRFGGGCGTCGGVPCVCPRHDFQSVKFS